MLVAVVGKFGGRRDMASGWDATGMSGLRLRPSQPATVGVVEVQDSLQPSGVQNPGQIPSKGSAPTFRRSPLLSL